jgi:hypothetical protein
VVVALPLQVLRHERQRRPLRGRPVPSGLIAACATPATVFTLDAASFTALFAADCRQQELPTPYP